MYPGKSAGFGLPVPPMMNGVTWICGGGGAANATPVHSPMALTTDRKPRANYASENDHTIALMARTNR